MPALLRRKVVNGVVVEVDKYGYEWPADDYFEIAAPESMPKTTSKTIGDVGGVTVKVETDGDGNTWLVQSTPDGQSTKMQVENRNPCGEIPLKDALNQAFGYTADFILDFDPPKISQEKMPTYGLNTSSLPAKKKMPAGLTERQQVREDALIAKIKLLRTAKDKAYSLAAHYKNHAGSHTNMIAFPDTRYGKSSPGSESIEASLLAMQQRFYHTLWQKAYAKTERKIKRLQLKLPSRRKQQKRPKKKAVPYRSKKHKPKYSSGGVVMGISDVMYSSTTSYSTNS